MKESSMNTEELKTEIASLERTVNNCGHKYGGKLLMKVAKLKKMLVERSNH